MKHLKLYEEVEHEYTNEDKFMRLYMAGYLHQEALDFLNTHDVDLSTHNNFIIQRAADNGHADIVELALADDRVDPLVNHNFPLRTSDNMEHTEVIKLLLNDERVINDLTTKFIDTLKDGTKAILAELWKLDSPSEIDTILRMMQ